MLLHGPLVLSSMCCWGEWSKWLCFSRGEMGQSSGPDGNCTSYPLSWRSWWAWLSIFCPQTWLAGGPCDAWQARGSWWAR